MKPTDNAVFTVRVLWRDAKIHNTPDAWRECARELGAMAFYAEGSAHYFTDYRYLRDMHEEALYMMENCNANPI